MKKNPFDFMICYLQFALFAPLDFAGRFFLDRGLELLLGHGNGDEAVIDAIFALNEQALAPLD